MQKEQGLCFSQLKDIGSQRGSGRGSNDKLINNFPFPPAWLCESPVLLKSFAEFVASVHYCTCVVTTAYRAKHLEDLAGASGEVF